MTRFRRLVALHRSLAVATGTVAVTAIVVLVQGGAQASVEQTRPRSRAALVAIGRQLYVPGCSGCHGLDGGGLRTPGGQLRGPSLKEAGEAGAYYWVHTGRMPLASPEQIPQRKEPAYNSGEIDALVAYVGSLDDGPPIPRVNLRRGNLAEGGEIFRGICAACHSASGAGGALSYGNAAPSLQHSQPLEVGSAVRVGPGQMPRFGVDTITPRQLDSVVRYVEYLRHPDDPGGLALGRIGPIPEGFLIWVFGIGLLLVTVAWIGKRNRPATFAAHPPPDTDR